MQKKVYFLSDFHLGAPNFEVSLQREKKIVTFLESIRHETKALFLVGDLFDFWFEYRKVVPKGYTRLLGCIASFSDAGIPVHFFVGNHDMWVKDYFQQELGMKVYFEPAQFEFGGKQFLVGHGDGLGPGDYGYKRLKKIFRNPLCQWLFGILPPGIGLGIANFSSSRSRLATGTSDGVFLGEENEWLIQYCKKKLETHAYDYLVFGHRHLPIDFQLKGGARYVNLGDWIRYFTYAVFDGSNLELLALESQKENLIVRKS